MKGEDKLDPLAVYVGFKEMTLKSAPSAKLACRQIAITKGALSDSGSKELYESLSRAMNAQTRVFGSLETSVYGQADHLNSPLFFELD